MGRPSNSEKNRKIGEGFLEEAMNGEHHISRRSWAASMANAYFLKALLAKK